MFFKLAVFAAMRQLGQFVESRVDRLMVCRDCRARFQKDGGHAAVLKEWCECWRIRCSRCGAVLQRDGDDHYVEELRWPWYSRMIESACLGSLIVEDRLQMTALARRPSTMLRNAESPRQSLSWHDMFDQPCLVGFGLNRTFPLQKRPRMGSLRPEERLLLLAAVGEGSAAGAAYARRLLWVWQRNRQILSRQAVRPRQPSRARPRGPATRPIPVSKYRVI
jgi:hypothetical protein